MVEIVIKARRDKWEAAPVSHQSGVRNAFNTTAKHPLAGREFSRLHTRGLAGVNSGGAVGPFAFTPIQPRV